LPLGRPFLIAGAVLLGIGMLLTLAEKVPGLGLGRLPGDFVWRRGSTTFYFPLATCIIVSLVLTLLFRLFRARVPHNIPDKQYFHCILAKARLFGKFNKSVFTYDGHLDLSWVRQFLFNLFG
jgi:hypothetical protein